MTKTKFFSMFPAILQIVYSGIFLAYFGVTGMFLFTFRELFVPIIITLIGNAAAAVIIYKRDIDLTYYAGWFTAQFLFPTAITFLMLFSMLIMPNDYTAIFVLAAVQGGAFLISLKILYKQIFLTVPVDSQRLKAAAEEFFIAIMCSPWLYVMIFMLCGILLDVAAYHFDWRW